MTGVTPYIETKVFGSRSSISDVAQIYPIAEVVISKPEDKIWSKPEDKI